MPAWLLLAPARRWRDSEATSKRGRWTGGERAGGNNPPLALASGLRWCDTYREKCITITAHTPQKASYAAIFLPIVIHYWR